MKATLINERAELTNYKLKRRLKPIKDESGKREKLYPIKTKPKHETNLSKSRFCIFAPAPNGLRYLRWGGDGEAVQPEKR